MATKRREVKERGGGGEEKEERGVKLTDRSKSRGMLLRASRLLMVTADNDFRRIFIHPDFYMATARAFLSSNNHATL